MSISEKLEEHLSQFSTTPFLFVGSGLSRRYIDLETWEDLLRNFAKLTSKPYGYFSSSSEGNYPKLATEISLSLHEKWWEADEFADSRAEFEKEASQDKSSALKIEIAKYIKDKSKNITTSPELVAELEEFRKVVVDGIITTNWDLLLESLFPSYHPYVGQNELLFSAPQQVAEIYKIHGDCTVPNSLVLTERDYQVFDQRNPYLVAKLLTIFIEHPVIFLGYSLTDKNIVKLLGEVIDCLTTENIGTLQNRLIFVSWDASLSEASFGRATIVSGDKRIPVFEICSASFLPIYQSLAKVKRRFPAKLLRQLKEHIYELVSSNDPGQKMSVIDIENNEDVSKLEVVFGVGTKTTSGKEPEAQPQPVAKVGYKALTRADLMYDVVFGTEEYNPREVVDYSIPDLIRATPFVPFFKYLSALGHLDNRGKVTSGEIGSRIISEAERTLEKFKSNMSQNKEDAIRDSYSGFKDLYERGRENLWLVNGPHLADYQMSADELQKILQDNFSMFTGEKQQYRTQFGKMVCLYDFLRYRMHK